LRAGSTQLMPPVVELLIALAHAVYRPATDDAYGQFHWNGLDLTSRVRFGCYSPSSTRGRGVPRPAVTGILNNFVADQLGGPV
jgi:hypothetical protein